MNSIKNHLPEVNTLGLYRMPWSFSDNPFSWLEPTRNCDLSCEYCYQEHNPRSYKTVAEFESDLKGLLKLRKCDAINIAGGEPLIHPDILDIVALVKSHGLKPVLITNGNRLTKEFARDLKAAGAYGFTFHVDSLQNRPGWEGKDEKELNELRQYFADMIFEEGGLVCGFNTTIVPSMLHQVGNVIKWTISNNDRVATNMIIPVRQVPKDDCLEYYAGSQKLDADQTVYAGRYDYRPITAMELYREALKVVPDFTFNSYLGGTMVPNAPKWLFANIIASRQKIYGYLGPKGMEIIQNGFHLIKGGYISYLRPEIYQHAKLLLPLAAFDKGLRKAFGRYLLSILTNPLRIFKKLTFQTIIIMQPQDFLENGEQDMCDGCPNRTYINGRLVSECRGEDYIKHGRMIQAVRKVESVCYVEA
ncbi:MAG: hypothetical protein A2W19_14650 [Spirochaetes bacterium RBG_16_49_21]|nr:MAG: hypothetical protein A2W19_14650 [Spirochaetes bacterium RBG_16_49_21]